MKSNNKIVYILLLLLTGLTFFAGNFDISKGSIAIIFLIAMLKISLVSYYFMELKAAHKAWQTIMLLTGLLIIGGLVALY